MQKFFFVLLSSVILFSSCEKGLFKDQDKDISEQFVEDVSVETRTGPKGCFEIVFPISIQLPDDDIIEVESWEIAKEELKNWKEANPDVNGKPSLVYPIDLINDEGELMNISDRQELKKVVIECKKEYGYNGHGEKKCFHIVFPVEIQFPDGSSKTFDTRKDLKIGIKEWKSNNPEAEERPSLVFPVQVKLKGEESTTLVESKDALLEIKENC